jgi:hypothetical protein
VTPKDSIRPIETNYAGCRFRSRLEARWAVFFDALGLRWEYEPQGFVVTTPDEGGLLPPARWHYLPDFYLPGSRTWVEVKGSLGDVPADYFKMIAHAVDWGGQLPDMRESFRTARGLLWLGPIPTDALCKRGLPNHVLLQHGKGGWIADTCFTPEGLRPTDTGEYAFDSSYCGIEVAGETIREGLADLVYDSPGWWPAPAGQNGPVFEAYRKARQARFEWDR